jgi:transposase
MKMLPLLPDSPVKVARDAARAVKRTAHLMVRRATATTLSTLLGLSGMVVTEYAIEQEAGREVLRIFCHHEHEVALRSRCGELSEGIYEQEECCIRHLDIWGKVTYVHFPSRRFDCKHGKKPFTESLSWVESKRRESAAYELHVCEQCKRTDQAAVAEREGLHAETVKSVFHRWARRAEKQRQYTLGHCLSVDGISLRKGHQQYALVLSDLERHCVIAILPKHSQKALQHWWKEFLNYFNEGFTSAMVEGLNNAIRGAIRRAYGYHVFEYFRLRALVEHGNLSTPIPQIRREPN